MKSSTLTVAFLILVNLIPVFGVLFLGWDLFSLMMLYWMENVIIGFFNGIKMAFAGKAGTLEIPSIAMKLFMIPFFSVHYGIFCFVHGMFIIVFFRNGGLFAGNANSGNIDNGFPSSPFEFIFSSPNSLGSAFSWVLLSMVLSHGLSLVLNFFGQKEYMNTSVEKQMFQPYQRIVILHLTIIFGAFLTIFLGSPVFALILMALLKIIVDVWAHLREHRKAQEKVLSTI